MGEEWEMEEGMLHCGNYTRCDPIPISNHRAATSMWESNEKEK